MSQLVSQPDIGEFILFPKLAPELRQKIWKYAVDNSGRIIKMLYRGRDTIDPSMLLLDGGMLPSVFFACKESYKVASGAYCKVPSLRGLIDGNRVPILGTHKTLINFALDTIFFTSTINDCLFLPTCALSWVDVILMAGAEKFGGRNKVLHHLAVPEYWAKFILKLQYADFTQNPPRFEKTAAVYLVCNHHYNLKTLTFVYGHTVFKRDPEPHKYYFAPILHHAHVIPSNVIALLNWLRGDIFEGPFEGGELHRVWWENLVKNRKAVGWEYPRVRALTVEKH